MVMAEKLIWLTSWVDWFLLIFMKDIVPQIVRLQIEQFYNLIDNNTYKLSTFFWGAFLELKIGYLESKKSGRCKSIPGT